MPRKLSKAQEQAAALRAVSIERFQLESANVVAPDVGEPPVVSLQLFAGFTPPNGVFMFCKDFTLTADLAVQIGEALAESGRSARSDLIIAKP